MLDVGDGHEIYWEVRGNPAGKPAVALHGGPGSGCAPWWADFFDLRAYRVLLFDQRACGRSRPHTLAANTTQHLIADIERLREHLGVERWLVIGGSWGSTLGLAYAQAHPDRVTELVLFSVGMTSRAEVEWMTRGVGRLFPEAWARFRAGVPERERDGSLVDAYSRLLAHPDPAVRDKAARDWCAWEDALVSSPPSPRYEDPAFRLNFARLVTHYWRHAAFLPDGALLRGLDRLRKIPGVMVDGRDDVGMPLGIASTIAESWGEHVIVDEGHGATASTTAAIAAAVARFA